MTRDQMILQALRLCREGKIMVSIDEYDVTLLDDGTLDTVVEVTHPRWDEPQEFRYDSTEFAAYRDSETGCLDLEAFAEEVVIPDCELEG